MAIDLLIVLTLLACGDERATPDRDQETTEPAPPEPPIEPSDTQAPAPELVHTISADLHELVGSIVVVSWEQTGPADLHLEYSFDTDVWVSTPTRSLEAGAQQELLLGIPYGEQVTWRLIGTDAVTTITSPDDEIEVAELPAGIPVANVTISDPTRYDAVAAPYWLVGLATDSWANDGWWVVIVDRAGRVVWANRTPLQRSSMHARVARDGRTLLLDRNSFWPTFDGGAASRVDQVTIDGTVVHTFQTPGMHHPFTDMPDGSIAYGLDAAGSDEVLRILHVDGTYEDVWSCEQWLQSIGLNDSCASNTITYDEATNKFLFSFYSLETIVEIDRTTGAVDRWWGQLGGSWRFDPPGSELWWQHGGVITDDGTLLTSTDSTAAGGETIVREYALDDATATLVQEWVFGLGDGLLAGVMGEVVRLPNGNTVHNTGALPRLREAATDGVVVWDIAWGTAGAVGRSMPIADLYALAPAP